MTAPDGSPAARATVRSVPLEIRRLSKSFGTLTAVDDLSFDVAPGRVTGFLGPNGSGKTTTLRMLLGLTRPTAGSATIDGRPYQELRRPLRVVGASLEASSFHPGRSAYDHLRCFAPLAGVSDARCLDVLGYVGLAGAARRRVGGYSLGMRQRLALAQALLGDPQVLVLDEPTNGLDPEGIRWLRELLRSLAAEGRTVLVSSHLLGEVQQSVDDVVVISRGRLRHASSLAELARLSRPRVRLVTPDGERLSALAADRGWELTVSDGPLRTAQVVDVTAREVGAASFAAGLELFELADVTEGLEEIFLRLVGEDGPAPGDAARDERSAA